VITIAPAVADDVPAILPMMAGDAVPQWPDHVWRDAVSSPRRWVWTAHNAGGAVGVACVSHVADDCELEMIAVLLHARGGGTGATLLRHALVAAALAGCTRMLLEVSVRNSAAIALYRALTFVDVDIRRGYYKGGNDALIMQRDLRPIAAQRGLPHSHQ
jgi:[ribosomal protein S18]-alanine N-acetyltransferase